MIKKGTLFVALFMLLMVGACKGSGMQAGAEWLREPDSEDVQSENILDIPATDIYEVTASKINIAFMELEQISISKITPELAVCYTGHYYTSAPGKQPYLVRAVYGHAGTGAFSLKRLEDDLLILHQSIPFSPTKH